jgi:hypothetical protein
MFVTPFGVEKMHPAGDPGGIRDSQVEKGRDRDAAGP